MRAFCESLVAALALLVSSPLLVLIALAVKLGDGGPVFYSHVRIGKDFQPFRLLKFRSMVSGADRSGPITVARDTRTTKVGRHLRKYKLDELPQLFNVVRGEMQFVGTRPEVEHYVNLFREQYAVLLRDRPGITDAASLAYRQEEKLLHGPHAEQHYVAQILPDKLRISLAYQQRRTPLSDLVIVLRTIVPSRTESPSSQPAPANETSVNHSTD